MAKIFISVDLGLTIAEKIKESWFGIWNDFSFKEDVIEPLKELECKVLIPSGVELSKGLPKNIIISKEINPTPKNLDYIKKEIYRILGDNRTNYDYGLKYKIKEVCVQ